MTHTELHERLLPLVKRVEEAAPSNVLDQITAAVSVGAELNRLGDVLINVFVDAARTEGHSWAEIGTSLGVSRQAAQQRLGRFQQVPLSAEDGLRQKGSPFAAWRLTDDKAIEVQVDTGNAWQRLVSLDGHPVGIWIAAAKRADGRRWFKRLSEDIDEVCKEMGTPLAQTMTAGLADASGRESERTVDVTIAKRQAAWRHNRSA